MLLVEPPSYDEIPDIVDVEKTVEGLVSTMPAARAAAEASKLTGLPRKELYQRLLDMKDSNGRADARHVKTTPGRKARSCRRVLGSTLSHAERLSHSGASLSHPARRDRSDSPGARCDRLIEVKARKLEKGAVGCCRCELAEADSGRRGSLAEPTPRFPSSFSSLRYCCCSSTAAPGFISSMPFRGYVHVEVNAKRWRLVIGTAVSTVH